MADPGVGTAETEPLGPSLWVLKLTGEHDLSTAAIVDTAFEPIEASGTTVLVDFTETSFMDSTVVGALIKRVRNGETLLSSCPRTAPLAGRSISSASRAC